MDYQKAIESLRLEGGIEITGNPRRVAEFFEGIDVAISAMQELQAIQDNGISPERLKDIDFRKKVVEHINYMDYMDIKAELEEYKQIGTLEEVREAVERQRAKKPKTKILCGDIEWWCPNCGENHIMLDSKKGFDFCHHCGQKLDWGE